MKRILILCLSLYSISTASSKIALTIKVNGKVFVIEEANSVKQPLKLGTPLKDKDKILTGKNGFVAIMYLDDKSVIKMLGNSDLTVSEIEEAYADYCPRKGWNPKHITAIRRELEGLVLELFGKTKSHSIKRDGKSQRGFRGIAFKDGGDYEY